MKNRIDEYKEDRNNLDINNIKKEWIQDITKEIYDNKIDYNDIAMHYGMTEAELKDILRDSCDKTGSQIMLVSSYLKSKVLSKKMK